jgi:hypothetical protein
VHEITATGEYFGTIGPTRRTRRRGLDTAKSAERPSNGPHAWLTSPVVVTLTTPAGRHFVLRVEIKWRPERRALCIQVRACASVTRARCGPSRGPLSCARGELCSPLTGRHADFGDGYHGRMLSCLSIRNKFRYSSSARSSIVAALSNVFQVSSLCSSHSREGSPPSQRVTRYMW